MLHKSLLTMFNRYTKSYSTEVLTYLAQQLTNIVGRSKTDRFVIPSQYEFKPQIRTNALYMLHLLPVDIYEPDNDKSYYVYIKYPQYTTIVIEEGSVCTTLNIKQEFKAWFRNSDITYGINACYYEYKATNDKKIMHYELDKKEYVFVKDDIVYVAIPLILLLVKPEIITDITETTLDHFYIEHATGKFSVYAKLDIDNLLYKQIIGCGVYAYSSQTVFSFYTDINHYSIYDAYARRFGFLTSDRRHVAITTQNVKGKVDYEHPDTIYTNKPILTIEIVHPSVSVDFDYVNLVYLTTGENITITVPQQVTYIKHIDPNFELIIKVNDKQYRNYNAYWNSRIAEVGLSHSVLDTVINNQFLYLMSTNEYVD